MANTYLKPTVIAATALGMLERELVLPMLIKRMDLAEFRGALNDTVTMKVPARLDAHQRALRATTAIVLDDLNQIGVDVSLKTDVYSAVRVTDAELTLDIVNFATDVLAPQITAVARDLENEVAQAIEGATYPAAAQFTIQNNAANVQDNRPATAFFKARNYLNKQFVPLADRIIVMGSDVEEWILSSDQFNRYDSTGDSSALYDAQIDKPIAGAKAYVSQAIDPKTAYYFHKDAFVLVSAAPIVPDGATFGTTKNYNGLAMRWIRDYDATVLADRSIVNSYIGANVVADGRAAEVQTVTVTGVPTGGTYTITVAAGSLSGVTVAIPFNASAVQVRKAINDTDIAPDAQVTGNAGGPYTVTFPSGTNVTQMAIGTNSLTGGTAPNVAFATTTEGSSTVAGIFVRGCKLTLAV